MPAFNPQERTFLEAVAELAYCNPFSPSRPQLERVALGPDFREGEPAWSLTLEDPSGPLRNGELIAERVADMLPDLRQRQPTGAEQRLYEGAVLYHLYYKYSRGIYRDPSETAPDDPPHDWSRYRNYVDEWDSLLGEVADDSEPAHVFAIFFQMRRAFYSIYRHIIGSSPAAARLRSAVWQSIFTHHMRRYRRGLYRRMGDFSTLVTGPSGTGKELVARAIALSRYIAFNPSTLRFRQEPDSGFHAINLAALSPTLIESELFGHRKGAFTGAAQDRKGWLEACPPHGTVFLDEIGELDAKIQVKLLRVIQTRTFQRVGETTTREFHGKIIAATNRDLGKAVQSGEFREDFYYRLCSDLIETVSLADQLQEGPDTLRQLVRFMARRVAGDDFEELAADALSWIERNLEASYGWPGNYRELEQCVRNILIQGNYRPLEQASTKGTKAIAAGFFAGAMTAEEVLRAYCTIVYAQTGAYAETARRLEIDQRTAKSKVDRKLLAELKRADA